MCGSAAGCMVLVGTMWKGCVVLHNGRKWLRVGFVVKLAGVAVLVQCICLLSGVIGGGWECWL